MAMRTWLTTLAIVIVIASIIFLAVVVKLFGYMLLAVLILSIPFFALYASRRQRRG